MKKKIVVSAINFVSGGPLSVMNDCLAELSNNYSDDYEIIALVNNKSLYSSSNIHYIEFPLSKKSWFIRLFYEYIYFYFFSKKLKPDYWLSMHDITPNVKCKNRFVYCHNPTPFYTTEKKDIIKNTKTFLFSSFYKHLYRISIKKNKYVIVQQNWIRKEFIKFWNLKNVLVAYPDVKQVINQSTEEINLELDNNLVNFFYPSFPRPFKNFEIICEAYRLLPSNYKKKCKIHITINGSLNTYSKEIHDKYTNHKGINFLGLLSREEVYEYYKYSDCLIFPSKLETWGLPITEYKETLKPMLLANESYAKETLGDYERVAFFDSSKPDELKDLMISFIDRTIEFSGNKSERIKEPFTKGWTQLLNKILYDQ
ncbi:glycosyltransferase [Aquimarina sp. SS2-1]|uniref:glycosyltransferase n=1 Tax=Aquimarina besae TaxID=3342247 RepID=UPI003671EF7C